MWHMFTIILFNVSLTTSVLNPCNSNGLYLVAVSRGAVYHAVNDDSNF